MAKSHVVNLLFNQPMMNVRMEAANASRGFYPYTWWAQLTPTEKQGGGEEKKFNSCNF